MFRWSKKILLAGFASAFLLAGPVLAEEPLLCQEDEYVVLTNDEGQVRIFSPQGEVVGSTYGRVYREDAEVRRYPADGLLFLMNEGQYQVFSLEAMRVVAEFPVEGLTYSQCENGFLVAYGPGQWAAAYRNDGTLLSMKSMPFASDEWGYWTKLHDFQGGLLWSVYDTDHCEMYWVSLDGLEVREVTAPVIRQFFSEGNNFYEVFGNGLLFSDYKTQTGTLVDLEGNILLQGNLKSLWETSGYDIYSSSLEDRVLFLYEERDGVITVYDEDLSVVRTAYSYHLPYSNTGYGITLVYKDGFFLDFVYEELGYRSCAGFVRYNEDSYIPYAREDKMYYLYVDGELQTWELEWDEEPQEMNNSLLLTRYYEGELERYRLRNMDGTVVWSSPAHEGWESVSVGKTSLLYSGYLGDRYVYQIYGNDMTLLYETNSYIYEWGNDCYYMYRGIYCGLTTATGEWILRTPRYEE